LNLLANSNSRILIIGGNSTIGAELYKTLSRQGFDVDTTTRRVSDVSSKVLFLDLADNKSYRSIFKHHYDSAIICSAVTSVAACQKEPKTTKCINVDATIGIINQLSERGTHIIFISTSLVFDGSTAFAKPFNKKNPSCHYGDQKAIVEDYLLTNNLSAAIIRFTKVIPPQYPLFVNWISSLRLWKTISPYVDKNIAPVSLTFAVSILSWLTIYKKVGLYQVSSEFEITYSDAALHLAELTCLDTSLIKPISSFNPYITSESDNKVLFSTLQFSPQLPSTFSIPSPFNAIKESLKKVSS